MVGDSARFVRGRCDGITYRVRNDSGQGAALAAYIRERRFLQLDESNRLYTHNRRNRIYAMQLDDPAVPVILKVSCNDPGYAPGRRLLNEISRPFRDNIHRAFRGCCALEEAGVPAAKALAFWRHWKSRLTFDSYLVYERIACDYSIRDIRMAAEAGGAEARDKLQLLMAEVGRFTARLHARNLRHYDLAPGNFLVRETPGGEDGSPRFSLFVLDYDSVSRPWFRIPGVKTFFDMRCHRRLRLDDDLIRCFFNGYFEGRYSPLWWRVRSFWQLSPGRRLRGK